jgi:hypothetical protein
VPRTPQPLPDALPTGLPAQVTRRWLEQYQENRWLNLGDTSQIEVVNPFAQRTKYDIENPHVFVLDLMRKPENFGFTCKVLFDKTLAPFQIAILRELWGRAFPMLIGSRGAGKSFLLAVYAMLRALFHQGSKIIICGAAFRQAKVVFDYCQELWESGPVLRDIVGSDKRNGPRRDVDRCTLRMGDSIIVALPLGDGQKIRGQRANIIICDEFASVPKDIFETVVRGFAAVSLDPVAQYQSEMRRVALKELGLWTEAHEALADGLESNQTIISGRPTTRSTTSTSTGSSTRPSSSRRETPGKLEEVFGGKMPRGFNWKDYSVIRIPVDACRRGFMDEKSLAQAKATVHSGTYQMEYGACLMGPKQLVTTAGVKRIVDIESATWSSPTAAASAGHQEDVHRLPGGPTSFVVDLRHEVRRRDFDRRTTRSGPAIGWEVGGLAHDDARPPSRTIRDPVAGRPQDLRGDWMEVRRPASTRGTRGASSVASEVADIRAEPGRRAILPARYGVRRARSTRSSNCSGPRRTRSRRLLPLTTTWG